MSDRETGPIPEIWPPVNPVEPVRARRIHWLLSPVAALAVFVAPRRIGPHLAASGWMSAYVAHFFSIAAAMGLLMAMGMEAQDPEEVNYPYHLPPGEQFRRPFAALVLFLYGISGTQLRPPPASVIAPVVALQVLAWLGAMLVMPFHAAGERPRHLYRRCVKLLLWSAAALFGVALLVVLSIGPILRTFDDRFPHWMAEQIAFALLFAGVMWYLSVIFRLGGRYGGPKDGPRWDSGPLRCEACGYTLAGLPIEGRCPECGRPVRDSLPDRRTPPPFAQAFRSIRSPLAYARTVWHVWRTRRLGNSLPAHRGEREARHFALLTCVLFGLLCGVASLPLLTKPRIYVTWAFAGGVPYRPERPWLWYVLNGVQAAQVGALAAGACLVAVLAFATRFGWREPLRRSIVVCYASAWLYAPLVPGAAGSYVYLAVHPTTSRWRPFELPPLGWIDPDTVVLTLLLAPALVALVITFIEVRSLLRATRYANG